MKKHDSRNGVGRDQAHLLNFESLGRSNFVRTNEKQANSIPSAITRTYRLHITSGRGGPKLSVPRHFA